MRNYFHWKRMILESFVGNQITHYVNCWSMPSRKISSPCRMTGILFMEDTSQLHSGPAVQVVPSTNQGQLAPFLAPTTNWEQHNHVIIHNNAQTAWLEDNHANEACKNLIILILDKIYLEKLWNERFGFKGKSLRDFMDLLINTYQATPEERAAVKALIKQP